MVPAELHCIWGVPELVRHSVATDHYGTSTAPRSQMPVSRGWPRWSVASQLDPAPSAALPVPGSIVNVGPPLSAGAANVGSPEIAPETHEPEPPCSSTLAPVPISPQPLLRKMVLFSVQESG